MQVIKYVTVFEIGEPKPGNSEQEFYLLNA